MSEERALTIIKSAILLEKKGQAIYQQVADQAKSEEVKQFFLEMVQDEKNHEEMLTKHFEFYNQNKRFDPNVNQRYTTNAIESILNPNLKNVIEAASYEAAAITAAIGLEKNSVELYGKRGIETSDSEEKALYLWLAQWEQGHLDLLMELDDELQKKVWYDNSFWPM